MGTALNVVDRYLQVGGMKRFQTRLCRVSNHSSPNKQVSVYRNQGGMYSFSRLQIKSYYIGHTPLLPCHYDNVTMSLMASQITSLTIVYSTVYSGEDQRKHQSSASLAFVGGIHRGPLNSPHKWPVTRKMFPFDDVIMSRVLSPSSITKTVCRSVKLVVIDIWLLSPVNSPHKGQWRGTLMFSLIYAWISDWVNNHVSGDLRRHRAHYDVNVMCLGRTMMQVMTPIHIIIQIHQRALYSCRLATILRPCVTSWNFFPMRSVG